MDPSEADLDVLRAAHAGDETAARRLWDRHGRRLILYARTIVRREPDAEDVVQSVFCRLVSLPRSQVLAVCDVSAWLSQVTRRESLNHLRAATRHDARLRRLPRLNLSGRGHGQPPAPDDLLGIIEALPRRFREMIVLKHFIGLTFDQIAGATGLNRNTAAARYRAALERLRRAVGTSDPNAERTADSALGPETSPRGKEVRYG